MSDKLGGWVALTPSNNHRFTGSAVAAALCLGLLAGTGGDVQREQVLGRMGTGSVQHGTVVPLASQTKQGLAADLGAIRSALRLSVAELADLFDVSRPTIYSWQNGNACKELNASRIRAIARALDPHWGLLSEHPGRVARRAMEGRANIIDLLKQGRDPAEVVSKLTALLKQEATQRELLARRLQGKTGVRGAADSEAFS